MRFINKEGNVKLFLLLLLHIIFAFLSVKLGLFAKIWGIVVLVFSVYDIYRTKNRNNEAAMWAIYYVSLEVLLRVTNSTVGYEMAKYFAAILLMFGEYLCPIKAKKGIWLLFLLLLIPGFFVTDWDVNDISKQVRSMISGPILLGVSAYYFTGRVVNISTYIRLMRMLLFPILSLAIVITLKTPDYSEIEFRSSSNFATSGGFSPVHISSVLGVGVIVLTIFQILRIKIFKYNWIDILLLTFLIFRILLSFSRSGTASAVITIIITLFVGYIEFRKRIKFSNFIIFAVLMFGILSIVWTQVNDITGGMAYNRFTGRNTTGERLEDITTNRSELFEQEINFFVDNPILGIGVGMTQDTRIKYYNNPHSSHTEYSRLLAEHGFLGVVALIILIVVPLRIFVHRKGYSKVFLIMFILYSLILLSTASTRTSLPLLIYGLGFIKIISGKLLPDK